MRDARRRGGELRSECRASGLCRLTRHRQYLTYTVVSGGAAERATDEEAIFEELRDLTTRWAVAATEASHSHRTVPTFASAPSPGALAGLAPDSHHYAPSSSARSRSGSTASGSTSARTLLGGRPGARQARIAAATAAAHAETTSSAQLRRIFAHERARRELPGGAPPLTTSRMLGASAAFRSREGVGIGGSDGRGGGTTRLAPPPRPSAAPAPPQPRNRTSVPLPRALEELARPTTRERAAQHLGESAGASALARRLGQRARKQADPFEREMRESVERGRALRTRGAS
jgi:hypothetical protein